MCKVDYNLSMGVCIKFDNAMIADVVFSAQRLETSIEERGTKSNSLVVNIYNDFGDYATFV